MDEKTTKGPMSQEVALVHLLKQVDGAVAHGAKVLMGGKRIDRPGSFMETTILTDIKPTTRPSATNSSARLRVVLPRQGRGRGHRAGQRLRLRPGRLGLPRI
jgi:hypothetical protein